MRLQLQIIWARKGFEDCKSLEAEGRTDVGLHLYEEVLRALALSAISTQRIGIVPGLHRSGIYRAIFVKQMEDMEICMSLLTFVEDFSTFTVHQLTFLVDYLYSLVPCSFFSTILLAKISV